MSESTNDSTAGFNKAAARQLFLLAAIAIASFALLLAALGWVTTLTRGTSGTREAVDFKARAITLSLSEEPPQLDSTRATDQVSGGILGHTMEGLLRYDEKNQLIPGVAESWEISDTQAVFHLREDARWSDGTPVTAHDFVFAWRKALEPATASEYAFILFALKNAEAINNGELDSSALGANAQDDRTLAVHLERPVAYFAKLMAFPTYFPIKQSFYESRAGRYAADAQDLLYNGAFVMTKWVHGAQVRLDKNPHYWNRDQIKLETIDFAYVTADVNATLNLFKDGKVASAGLDAENLHDALEQRWKINRFSDGSVFFIEFNYRPGRVTANYNLRRALQLVNDPGELVYKVIKLPGFLPGESLFPVWLKGVKGFFRQEYPAKKHAVNADLAREHLALALGELGLDEIPPLHFLTGDNPASNKQSEYYQNVFRRELGLDVKIDRQIFKQRLAKMTSGEFDMVMAGWGPDYDDPLTFGDLFASWNKNNRGRYSNAELDRLVAVAQSSTDPRTRMDAMGRIQDILIDDAVVLFNYERGLVYVIDDRVKGMVRRAVGTDPDYTYAYLVDNTKHR